MLAQRWLMSPLAAFSLAVFLPVLLTGKSGGRAITPVRVPARGAAVEANEGQVQEVALRTLHQMEQRLGMNLRGRRLSIEVYDGRASYERAGGLGNTDACYLPPTRVLVKDADGLQGDLAHEFGHVLISYATSDRCPGWLEEGVVNHENHIYPHGQYTHSTQRELDAAVRRLAKTDAGWTLDRLEARAQSTRHMNDAFYGASWSATDYLYRTYGRDTVLSAVTAMASQPSEQAFRAVFGKGRADIEREWKRTLAPRGAAGNRAGWRLGSLFRKPAPPAAPDATAALALRDMERRLNIRLRRRDIRVETFATVEAYRAAGGPGNTRACYLWPNRILVCGTNAPRAVLAHEFGHALVQERTRGLCPPWLEEGVINHENQEYDAGQMRELDAGLSAHEAEETDWTLDRLSRTAQTSGSMDDAFYGAAWYATDHLYQTHGRAAVLAWIHGMATASPEQAGRQALGHAPADAERAWRAARQNAKTPRP